MKQLGYAKAARKKNISEDLNAIVFHIVNRLPASMPKSRYGCSGQTGWLEGR